MDNTGHKNNGGRKSPAAIQLQLSGLAQDPVEVRTANGALRLRHAGSFIVNDYMTL